MRIQKASIGDVRQPDPVVDDKGGLEPQAGSPVLPIIRKLSFKRPHGAQPPAIRLELRQLKIPLRLILETRGKAALAAYLLALLRYRRPSCLGKSIVKLSTYAFMHQQRHCAKRSSRVLARRWKHHMQDFESQRELAGILRVVVSVARDKGGYGAVRVMKVLGLDELYEFCCGTGRDAYTRDAIF